MMLRAGLVLGLDVLLLLIRRALLSQSKTSLVAHHRLLLRLSLAIDPRLLITPQARTYAWK